MDWMKESEELVISPSVPSAKLGMPARINRVSLKETATLIASCGDHPLLAMRPAGKGRTAAATFALRKGWTGKLTPPGKTLRELIDLLSPSPLSPYHLAAEINDEGITITARGPQTGPIELHVEFHHFPGGGKGSVNLDQVSATTWQKRIPHPEPGVVWFKPVGFRGGNIALPIPYSLEYTRLGPDRNQLEEISRTTSGVPVRKLGDLNAGPGRKTKWQSGRTPFLIGVILLFLLDLAISAFWKPTRQIQIIKR